MAGLALAMFVTLFAFGDSILGYSSSSGQVQMGLFVSFIFGVICGYRTNK